MRTFNTSETKLVLKFLSQRGSYHILCPELSCSSGYCYLVFMQTTVSKYFIVSGSVNQVFFSYFVYRALTGEGGRQQFSPRPTLCGCVHSACGVFQ